VNYASVAVERENEKRERVKRAHLLNLFQRITVSQI